MFTLNDLLNLLKPQHLDNILRQAQKDISLFHWIHELRFINNSFFECKAFSVKKWLFLFCPKHLQRLLLLMKLFFYNLE